MEAAIQPADPGSFRDPRGHVYGIDGRVFRTITESAVADYKFARDNGNLEPIIKKGWLINSWETDQKIPITEQDSVRYLLEHPRLDFISYPYEWSFSVLKAAALLHLDLHMSLMDRDLTLSDATAYNVQFQGPKPIFIDTLSICRYREGMFWTAHRQFCEQFLNPLLLRALVGVSHNAWFRGNLEGIPTGDLTRMIPLGKKFSWNVYSQVVLQAKLQAGASGKSLDGLREIGKKKLPRIAYVGMLKQLRNWIAHLEKTGNEKTVWQEYEQTHTYSQEEEQKKHAFIDEFVQAVKPKTLMDLGCNVGHYSATALKAGVDKVVGFDFDHNALDILHDRALSEKLNILPLFLDAANPSPNQGWQQTERSGMKERFKVDAVMALAFEHHLAIGRNIPLDDVVDWITGFAPHGVVEFVRKDDPTVKTMLAVREDIFPEYNEESFERALRKRARIVKSITVTKDNRRLYWFDKTQNDPGSFL